MQTQEMLDLKEGDLVRYTAAASTDWGYWPKIGEVLKRKNHWMDDDSSVLFTWDAGGEYLFCTAEELEFIKE